MADGSWSRHRRISIVAAVFDRQMFAISRHGDAATANPVTSADGQDKHAPDALCTFARQCYFTWRVLLLYLHGHCSTVPTDDCLTVYCVDAAVRSN